MLVGTTKSSCKQEEPAHSHSLDVRRFGLVNDLLRPHLRQLALPKLRQQRLPGRLQQPNQVRHVLGVLAPQVHRDGEPLDDAPKLDPPGRVLDELGVPVDEQQHGAGVARAQQLLDADANLHREDEEARAVVDADLVVDDLGEVGHGAVVDVALGRRRGRYVKERVEERRERVRPDRRRRRRQRRRGHFDKEVVEDAVGAPEVGNLPDNVLALVHAQPVEVHHVRGAQRPDLARVERVNVGKARGGEHRRAHPQGVALHGGNVLLARHELRERLLEHGRAVVHVQRHGRAVRGARGAGHDVEVGVLELREANVDVVKVFVLEGFSPVVIL